MTGESIAAQPVTYLRALGKRERCLYRYAERNPLHFVLVAEFDMALDAHSVGDALQAVQHRHPLLSAHIKDDPDKGPGFYRADPVAPIDLTFHRDVDDDWEEIAAAELKRPFDLAAAPLMRATLLTQGMASTLLLTFDHTIADGISAILVLNDLLAALNGEPLHQLPLPNSLEDLVSRSFQSASTDDPSPKVDPRMAVPTSIRPFDATWPHLHRVAMDRDVTALLVQRCREERTTAHAAIVTAASRVRGAQCGEDFVRAYSPVNARGLATPGPTCCLCISFACTGMPVGEDTSFWCQARGVSNQLVPFRSPSGLMLGSAIIDRLLPVDADCFAAEHFLSTVLPFELTITNLGAQALPRAGLIRPHALWGPVILTQVEREYVTGVLTYDGRLRMVTCGYTPTAEFLDSVHQMLADASRYPR